MRVLTPVRGVPRSTVGFDRRRGSGPHPGASGPPGARAQVPGKQTLVNAQLENPRMAHGAPAPHTAASETPHGPSRMATEYPALARAMPALEPGAATIHDA